VDRVLPAAPYRQLVLSLPYKLRIHLARDPRFLSAMLGGYLKCVFSWQRHRGRVAGIDEGQTGAITFVQRFGSALNLNVHFHSLTPDGLFVPNAAGTLSFTPLDLPSNEDIARLGRRVFRRLTKIASRHLAHHEDEYIDIGPDDEQATLDHALSVALRPPVRPQRALPLQLGGLDQPDHASGEKDLCTAAGGFSLHAARIVEPHDREGLEGLCRYGLRAPYSAQRISLLQSGKVRYELPRPWPTPTGVIELIMEPLQFLKRLAVLLPAPFQNLTRYHGIFANRSRYRPLLPLPPQANHSEHRDDDANAASHPCVINPQLLDPPSGQQQTALPLQDPDSPDGPDNPDDILEDLPAVRPRRLPWASLLKRSLGVSGLECPRCQSQMVLLALITAPSTVERILDHLRIPSTPPSLAPARLGDQQTHLLDDDLDQSDPFDDPLCASSDDILDAAASRAPP